MNWSICNRCKKQTFLGQKFWLDKARIFLLVDLGDFFFLSDLGSGGHNKKL